MVSIGHFGAREDAIIKIRQFFEEKRALEVVEVIEVAEAVKVSKAVNIITEIFRVLGFDNSKI